MKPVSVPTVILLGSIATFVSQASAAVSIWDAQDLATGANGNTIFANGAIVTSWRSNDGRVLTNSANLGTGDPLLNTTGGYLGRAAVNFSNDMLGGPAASNPVVGFNQFTIAFSFRATAVGRNPSGQWWQNSGIVDAEQGGDTNDWGTAMNASGQLALGTGGGDTTAYTAAGYADSQLHAAILRFDGVTGNYDMFVDNGSIDLSNTSRISGVRNSFGLVFGGITTEAGKFAGDIAQVRIYTGVDSVNLNPVTAIQQLQGVPEPGSVFAISAGVAALALRRRRQRG